MSDEEADTLVAELAADGIVVTKDEARRAVHRLAELLLLISQPLPLPSPSDATVVAQGRFHAPVERDPLPDE